MTLRIILARIRRHVVIYGTRIHKFIREYSRRKIGECLLCVKNGHTINRANLLRNGSFDPPSARSNNFPSGGNIVILRQRLRAS